jgi:prepilin-type N-terminal cleavage/methylation domain-containing protein
MKISPLNPSARGRAGMTLLELLIAMGIGSLVLAVVLTLTVFAARSFIALGNYSTLDQQSRLGADVMTREIRQATGIVTWSSNATARSLTLTNGTAGYAMRYAWDSSTQELRSRKSTEAADRRVLTGCVDWTFSFWQRTPLPNQTNTFYTALTPAQTKLINMSWKCSRAVASTTLINTETVQTAQIVLRNQRSN